MGVSASGVCIFAFHAVGCLAAAGGVWGRRAEWFLDDDGGWDPLVPRRSSLYLLRDAFWGSDSRARHEVTRRASSEVEDEFSI